MRAMYRNTEEQSRYEHTYSLSAAFEILKELSRFVLKKIPSQLLLLHTGTAWPEEFK
jgi:hypothetical protein